MSIPKLAKILKRSLKYNFMTNLCLHNVSILIEFYRNWFINEFTMKNLAIIQ